MIDAKKVIADLEKFSKWEPPDSPRASAMADAAALLKHADQVFESMYTDTPDTVDDPKLHGHAYGTELDHDNKKVRFTLYRKEGKKGLLGYMVLTTPEVYDIAQKFLEKYDKLEGIT